MSTMNSAAVESTVEASSVRLFIPRWAGPIETYAKKSTRVAFRLFPHLAKLHDSEDLFNEAYCIYLLTKKRYVPPVDNMAWFMALYRRCLTSRYLEMKDRIQRWSPIEITMDDLPDSPLVEHHDGYLVAALHRLPQELVDVLQLLISAPGELVEPIGARTVESARARLLNWI